MKQIALFSLWMGCATPKSEADFDSGASGDADASGVDVGSGDGSADGATSDAGDTDSGDTDSGDTDSGDTDGGSDDGGTTGGETGETESGGSDDGGSAGTGTDGGAADGGTTDGSGGDDGGSSGSECLVDNLEFTATVSDSGGACDDSSPCAYGDPLTYRLVIKNDTGTDCVLTTPSACMIKTVRIEVRTAHAVDTHATYTPTCEPVEIAHTIPAGGTVEEILEAESLNYGTYDALINADMDSALAFGQHSFNVE